MTKIKLRNAARYAAFMVIAIALLAVAPHVYAVAKSFFAWRHVQTQALEVLQREQLRFLVTDRVVTQIVVESDENNPILGKREGYLIAKATLYFGVDFGKLSRDSITREGVRVVISIPEPEELDFAVDVDSMRYLTKRSGLQVLADWVMDRDQEAELRSLFKAATYSYLRGEDLLPRREQIVNRLNEFGGLISDSIGVEVVFR